MNRLPDVIHDGVHLAGIVVECAVPWHAQAGAITVGIHGDEAVTRRPQRERLPPLARAAHPTVQENHRRADAPLDDLNGAPTRHLQQGHEPR